MAKEFSKKGKLASLGPLLFIVFLDMLGLSLVLPLVPALFADNPLSILPIGTPLAQRNILQGLLVSVYAIASFFGAPLLGGLSDIHGRKKLLLVSIAGTMIAWLIFGLGVIWHDVWLLFLGRIIDGLTAGNIAVAQSAISDLSRPEDKAKNFGLISMLFGLGYILGPYIGGKLSDPTIMPWFDTALPIWFAASLSALNLLLIWRFFSETLKEPKPSARTDLLYGVKNIRKAMKMENLRTMFVVMFLLVFGFNFYTQFFSVFLIEKFHFNPSHIGDYFAYLGIWIALTQGLFTRVVAKFSPPQKTILFTGIALAFAIPVLSFAPDEAALFLIIPFVPIFWGLTQPNMLSLISNMARKDEQGEVLGITQSFVSLAQAIPPLVWGVVATVDINLPLLIAGVTVFAAWILYLSVYRNKHGVFKAEQLAN